MIREWRSPRSKTTCSTTKSEGWRNSRECPNGSTTSPKLSTDDFGCGDRTASRFVGKKSILGVQLLVTLDSARQGYEIMSGVTYFTPLIYKNGVTAMLVRIVADM